jgi:hypothetical protein
MTGIVLDLHALLPVTFLLGENGTPITLEFVIDTGFTGYLTLPEEAIISLQLPYLESIQEFLFLCTKQPSFGVIKSEPLVYWQRVNALCWERHYCKTTNSSRSL